MSGDFRPKCAALNGLRDGKLQWNHLPPTRTRAISPRHRLLETFTSMCTHSLCIEKCNRMDTIVFLGLGIFPLILLMSEVGFISMEGPSFSLWGAALFCTALSVPIAARLCSDKPLVKFEGDYIYLYAGLFRGRVIQIANTSLLGIASGTKSFYGESDNVLILMFKPGALSELKTALATPYINIDSDDLSICSYHIDKRIEVVLLECTLYLDKYRSTLPKDRSTEGR